MIKTHDVLTHESRIQVKIKSDGQSVCPFSFSFNDLVFCIIRMNKKELYMRGLYRNLVAPSAVHVAIHGAFVRQDAVDLAVSCANVLSIYALATVRDEGNIT